MILSRLILTPLVSYLFKGSQSHKVRTPM